MNEPPDRVVPYWTPRQVITATLFVVGVVLLFWLLYLYHRLILLMVIAIFFGTALRPVIQWLGQRGLSRGRSLILTLVFFLVLVIGLIGIVLPILIEQTANLAVDIPGFYRDIRYAMVNSPSRFLMNMGLNLPPGITFLAQSAGEGRDALDNIPRFFAAIGLVGRGFLAIVALILLMAFWIMESDRAIGNLLLLISPGRRSQVREFIAAAEVKVGAYLRGQLILSLSIAVLALVAYLLIGLPNALALAVLAGIFEAVPIFGPLLGAIPAFLVAYSADPNKALWVVVATVVIQGLENYLLVPRVMGASVGVSPLVTLLAMVTFVTILGFPGAILAIPMAALIQLVLERYLLSWKEPEENGSEGRDYVSRLRYETQDLVNDIRKVLRHKEELADGRADEVEDALEEIASDLDRVLVQVYEPKGEE